MKTRPGIIRGIIAALFATLAIVSLEPAPAAAAPNAQCFFGPLNHTSLSGQWAGDDGYNFVFNIYPCGGSSELFWIGADGWRYSAAYRSQDTLRGGGWIGSTYDGGPWGTSAVGYKPAEPGHLQLLFWAPHTPEQLIVRHARRVA